MRILLQPASGKEAMQHFEDTIASGVPLAYLKNELKPKEYQKIKQLGQRSVKVWGIVPTLSNQPRREWLDLKKNDWVLFYARKSFYFIAQVHLKIHNKKLAKELWGVDNEKRTWEYIYFIKEGKEIELQYIPSIIGYSDNHAVQRATLLDEEQSGALKKHVEENEQGTLDPETIEPSKKDELEFVKQVSPPQTVSEAEKEISRITGSLQYKPIETKIRTAKILSRNPRFARLVKERASYVCEICGQKPFIQKSGLPYAEAHHKLELTKIKFECPSDMICVCPICHRVIHHGNKKSLEDRKNLGYSK